MGRVGAAGAGTQHRPRLRRPGGWWSTGAVWRPWEGSRTSPSWRTWNWSGGSGAAAPSRSFRQTFPPAPGGIDGRGPWPSFGMPSSWPCMVWGFLPRRLHRWYRPEPPAPLRGGGANMVLVFARAPVEGKVKTRLAAGIGATAALNIYRGLGRRVVDQLRGGRYRLVICHDPPMRAIGSQRGSGPKDWTSGRRQRAIWGNGCTRRSCRGSAAVPPPSPSWGQTPPGSTAPWWRRRSAPWLRERTWSSGQRWMVDTTWWPSGVPPPTSSRGFRGAPIRCWPCLSSAAATRG
jgi:hypothetical protein